MGGRKTLRRGLREKAEERKRLLKIVEDKTGEKNDNNAGEKER